MGATQSQTYPDNDFELVITLAKRLENLLAEEFGASGNGLGEKANNTRWKGRHLSRDIKDDIFDVVRVRNEFCHNVECNHLLETERRNFIADYSRATDKLHNMLPKSRRQRRVNDTKMHQRKKSTFLCC